MRPTNEGPNGISIQFATPRNRDGSAAVNNEIVMTTVAMLEWTMSLNRLCR